MHKVSYFIFILLAFTGLYQSASSQVSYADKMRLRYEDHVYRDNIKTVQLHRTDWKFSPPILELNSGQELELDFDDFDGDYKSYYYTLVHCDANWQPSDMVPFDYLKGYTKDFLTDYANSFNTLQSYTHYRLLIPNNNMQIIVSGNYLLKIYLDDPDSLVLTRRLMVYENRVQIDPRESQPIGSEDMFTKQEIKFNINTGRYPISDPYNALQIVIMQNYRWDNAIVGIQPQFTQDGLLQYNADYGNIFDGGNQFRSFDVTSMQQVTEHVARIVPGTNYEEVDLKAEPPRTKMPYYTFQDIDGQYLIETKDADSSTINSDYVKVHFFLPLDSAFTTGNVYIFGQLSDWQCTRPYRMQYNADDKEYEATLYVKQGYYEYLYAFLKDGSKVADVTVLEGSHFETENSYTILAYYRPVGLFYDILIGAKTFKAPQ